MAIIPPLEKSLVVPDYPIFRLTVEQYHAMIKAGILTDDDPVELLEGWLVTKMPQNPPHLTITQHTHDVLRRIIPPGWFTNARGQSPLLTASRNRILLWCAVAAWTTWSAFPLHPILLWSSRFLILPCTGIVP